MKIELTNSLLVAFSYEYLISCTLNTLNRTCKIKIIKYVIIYNDNKKTPYWEGVCCCDCAKSFSASLIIFS